MKNHLIAAMGLAALMIPLASVAAEADETGARPGESASDMKAPPTADMGASSNAGVGASSTAGMIVGPGGVRVRAKSNRPGGGIGAGSAAASESMRVQEQPLPAK